MGGRPWTEEEFGLLETMYPTASTYELKNVHFPYRKRGAISDMARTLGLHKIKIEPNLSPSEELAYVIGVILGDGSLGHYSNGGYQITLHCKDRDFTELFNKCICKILNKEKRYAITCSPSQKGRYTTRAYSKQLFYFLKSQEIYRVIETHPADFIRGFADSEGSISWRVRWRSAEGMIQIGNTNKPLLEHIKQILFERFGIYSAIIRGAKAKNAQSKDCYVLRIIRKADIVMFAKLINFGMRRQRDKLAELLQRFKTDAIGGKTIERRRKENWMRQGKIVYSKVPVGTPVGEAEFGSLHPQFLKVEVD